MSGVVSREQFRRFVSLLLLVAALVLVFGLGLAGLVVRQNELDSERLVQTRLERSNVIGRLLELTTRAGREANAFLLAGDAQHLREREALLAQLDGEIAAARALNPNGDAAAWLAAFEAAEDEERRELNRVIEMFRNGDPDDARLIFLERVQPRRDALRNGLFEALTMNRQRLIESEQLARTGRRQVFFLFGSSVLLSLVCGGATVYGLRRYFQRIDQEHAAAESSRAAALRARHVTENVMEQMGDPVFVFDASAELVFANAAARVLQEDTTHGGQTLRQELAHHVLEGLEGKAVHHPRLTVPTVLGTGRELALTVAPMHGEDGGVVGCIATARDETERLRLERERSSNLAQLDQLVATAPIGIAVLDETLRCERANAPFCRLTGRMETELVGRRLAEHPSPPVAPELEQRILEVLRTGRTLENIELDAAGPLGEEHHLVAACFPLRLEDRTTGVVVLLVDATAQHQLEDELRRTAEFRERFVAVAAHELRTPVSALLLGVQRLSRTAPPDLKPTVARLERSTLRMRRLVKDMLDFARARLSLGLVIERQPGEIMVAVEQALAEVRLVRPTSEIRFEAHGDGYGLWDFDRIAQLVTNLVENALEHGQRENPVTVTLDGLADEVLLRVHNEGALDPRRARRSLAGGVLDADQPELRSGSGLGLGLFIVNEIAKGHGGTIDVRSSPDEGTTFEVHLRRGLPELREATLH